jgi:F0F1-type ATP synthase membrane subunit a
VFSVLGAAMWMAFFKGYAKTGLALMFGVPVLGLFGVIPGVGAAAFAEVMLATGWTLFHILIISLQAYIFMTLTVVYMAMAADHH